MNRRRVGSRVARSGLAVAVASMTAALLACQEHEFEPPDREAQVLTADEMYKAARFDTISWPSDSVRALVGNSVFSAECRQCHGSLGRGRTDYTRGRDFEVPSLVEQDWKLAGELDSVRHRIFIGHAEGMPTWGVAGIDIRDIDATAYYILEVLRPDVLEGGATLPGQEAEAAPADTSEG